MKLWKILATLATIAAVVSVLTMWKTARYFTNQRIGVTESLFGPETKPLHEKGLISRSGDAGTHLLPHGKLIAKYAFGSGPGQLGSDTSGVGHPEGPTSVSVEPGGAIALLDQANSRVVRVDRSGKRLSSTPLASRDVQDVAVSRDGALAVMSHTERTVALLALDGRTRGTLPLSGRGLIEAASAQGVFIVGNEVYAQREHGDGVRLGTTAGAADDARLETPGRLSRDGRFYVTATVTEAGAGVVAVNAMEKATLARKFSRPISFGVPVRALKLLDTDAAGTIYIAALIDEGSLLEPAYSLMVACLEPQQGKAVGLITLPATPTTDELFRPVALGDDGLLVSLVRTQEGTELWRAKCP